METIELQKITRWLDITEQQHEILQCIYAIEGRKEEVNPTNILKEYQKSNGKRIQTSNLFPLLKTLIEKDLIAKREKARYSINLDGISRQITKNQKDLQKELDEQKNVAEHLNEYFASISKPETHPIVKYYGYGEGFEKIAELLRTSNRYYLVSTFPNITWTANLAYGQGVGNYVATVQDRCLKEKKLEATYITSLEVDLLYRRLLKIHGEKKLAYTECETVINKIGPLLEENKNLDIRYLENPMGFFIAMPEREKPLDFFIFLRDATREIVGSIYIRSEEIAKQAKQQLMTESEKAVSLREPKGMKIIEKKKRELRQIYANSQL